MKFQRQSTILEIVEREDITSQEQLRAELMGRGIQATQATLSRDIRDLGLVKRAADGAYRRPGAAELDVAEPETVLRGAVVEYLRRLEVVDQMLVVKTDSGMAQPLAVAIDRGRVPEVAGTIAGDDTVLVICRGAAQAAALAARLDTWRHSPTAS